MSVARRFSNEDRSLLAIARKANFLKQAEQFEDDYDDNNYADYIEDASVHAVTDIRLGSRWLAFMQTEAVFTALAPGFTDSCARESSSIAGSTQSGCRMFLIRQNPIEQLTIFSSKPSSARRVSAGLAAPVRLPWDLGDRLQPLVELRAKLRR